MLMRLLIAFIAVAAASVMVLSAAAQQSTESQSVEDLGLPEMEIVVTDDSWEYPDQIEAGRYLISVTYEGTDLVGTAAFVQLPDGWSTDDLAAAIREDDSDATPAPSDGTTVEPADSQLGNWIYELTFAGGVSAPSGSVAQGIVDLTPGSWAIWADNATKLPVGFEVTGEMPEDLATPAATATITYVNDGDVYGMEMTGNLTPGQNIIEVVNNSDAPHLIEFVGLSTPLTREQVGGLIQTPDGQPADPALGIPEDLELFFGQPYAATQSAGTTQWIIADLSAGDYVAACWIPNRDDSDHTHAEDGQFMLVSVG